VEAHLSTTKRPWARLKWAYTTLVFLASPLDLLIDKAPWELSSGNSLITGAAFQTRIHTKSYQIF
jgi:hypothetical protein